MTGRGRDADSTRTGRRRTQVDTAAMPVRTTYPGVYLEELPSSVRSIVGVGTSTTAFVGYTARGLDNRPTRLFGFADFERAFGGLASDSLTSYAVSQYFANGGTDAVVVRVPMVGAVRAAITATSGGGTPTNELRITALSSGTWANSLAVDVDHQVPAGDNRAYNLTITDLTTGTVERFANVTNDATKPNVVTAVVNDAASGSRLVEVGVPTGNATRPAATGTISGALTPGSLGIPGRALKVTIELSGTESVVVETGDLLPSGATEPASVTGLCSLLERVVNAGIPATRPGVRVRCTPDDRSIRIQASIDIARDQRVDAPVRVEGPTTGTSALTTLGFNTAALRSQNVSHYLLGAGRGVDAQAAAVAGTDGTALPGATELVGSPAAFTGIFALEKVDLFNLLCLPDLTRSQPGAPTTSALSDTQITTALTAALALCEQRRAVLLVDPPANVTDQNSALDWISSRLTPKGSHAAAYFPRVRVADPLDDYRLRSIPPSGTVGGLIARIDSQRGVWKAPAGTEASLRGVSQLEYALSDAENGVLNPLGLNCLRSKPIYGTIVWGARTLDGADAAASQWKYLPVRRLALMIEESLFRGTQWAVFEPNDEGLWAQLRMNVQSYMHGLFRQGAFQGTKPADAYLVKCDAQTTTQADIDLGRVNILVGFAPLKPAEFVVIRIQQLAGESPA
jgi:phage tail sheath protein FI